MIISGVMKDGNLTPVTCTHLLPPIDPVFGYLPNPCWVFASWAQHWHHCQCIMIIYSFWYSLLLVLELSLPLSLKRSAQHLVPTLVTSHTLQDTWSFPWWRRLRRILLLCSVFEDFQGPWIDADGSVPFTMMSLSQLFCDSISRVLCDLLCFASIYRLALGRSILIWSFLRQKVVFENLPIWCFLCSYYSFSIAVYWMLGWECFQNWALARTAPEHSIFQYSLEKCWLLPVGIFYFFFLSGILSLLLIFRNFVLICSVCGLLLIYCPEHMVGVSTWKTMGFSSGNVSSIMGFCCSRCATYWLGFLSGASVSQRSALLS